MRQPALVHEIAESAADGEKQGADDGQRSSDASHGDTYERLRPGICDCDKRKAGKGASSRACR
jgi:hypothetical protein